ncbi:MAG: DUF192 domain-containing protein [Rhizobiaceae bacterium]
MLRTAGFLATAFVAIAIVASLAGGPVSAQTGKPMLLPVDPAPLIAMTASGEQQFAIEVADDNTERSRGLMFRRDLPQRRGMLFVFEDTRRVAFWMKNTPLPLDLIFLGEDGRVLDILPGVPFSEAPIAPAGMVRFVLELHEGTAKAAGIDVGDRLRHPEIDAIAGAD